MEGRCALDGGLVGLLVLPDIVGRAVAGKGTLLGATGVVAVALVLNNVVLDERVGLKKEG